MATVSIEHTYQYRFESSLWSREIQTGHEESLALATDISVPVGKNQAEVPTSFFDGVLLHPKRTAELLRGVAGIVAARFNNPNWQRLADPVVTCGNNRLRFEGFSSCCSAYARVDLLPEAVEGRWGIKGTTNVDFNSAMLAALRSVRDSEYMGLTVGSETVELSQAGQKIIERKVSLPIRWIKGFVEIQAYQSRMVPILEVSGIQARNFLHSIPRVKSRIPFYILPSGNGLRLSRIAGPRSVKAAGLERLRVLESFVHLADSLRIYGDEESGTSAWELVFPDARFHLLLSADVWRGFSGEGQILSTLAENQYEKYLDAVQAALADDSATDIGALSRKTGATPEEVRASLAALGARGLVGFDPETSSCFHRELPFELDKIESLHPRMLNARKLVQEGKVRVSLQQEGKTEAFVQGKDVEYFVRVNNDEAKCTCPWYAKYKNERGPCKHILAVRILAEKDQYNEQG